MAELARKSVVLVRCPDINLAGSGFVVSAEGQIATNNHVVTQFGLDDTGAIVTRYSADIRVRLADGSWHNAQLAVDTDDFQPIVFDYALLKLHTSHALPLETGDSSAVKLGDDVLCLGYPLDFDNIVVTQGIVSAFVTRPSHINAIHPIGTVVTDALIQYGNSGGPMVHVPTGKAIGINTLRHEIADELAYRLWQWKQGSALDQVPGLGDLLDYTLKYTYVGLNHAVLLRYAAADSAWEG